MNDPDIPSPWGKRPDNRPPKSENRPKGPFGFSRFLIGVIVFLVILVIAAQLLPESGAGFYGGGLLYDGLLLAFVGAGLWVHVRSSPGRALRHMASWVIIFGVLALGYSIYTGQGRLGGELDVAQGIAGDGSISYRADRGGHYFIRAKVNGVPINFMVDTGATDVALTREDALKIGLPVDRLSYKMPYRTANGVAYGAPVRLRDIAVGPIRKSNIKGSVLQQGLDHSLLGMSFLGQISGYKVVGGVLTLYP